MREGKLCYEATCDFCGKTFYPTRSSAKTCSERCRSGIYRDRAREIEAPPAIERKVDALLDEIQQLKGQLSKKGDVQEDLAAEVEAPMPELPFLEADPAPATFTLPPRREPWEWPMPFALSMCKSELEATLAEIGPNKRLEHLDMVEYYETRAKILRGHIERLEGQQGTVIK